MESIEQGIKLHGHGRMAEAEAVYHAALARDASHFDALHMLGLMRYQQRRFPEADELIQRAVKLRPRSAPTLSLSMAIMLELGRLDEALSISDRIDRIDADNLDHLFNRALLLSRLQRWDDALATYDKLLARQPDLVAALFERGNLLAQLSRFEEAEACYRDLLRKAPGHPGALTNRGNALMLLRRHAEALACYDQLAGIRAADVNVLSNRAIVLKELGRYDEGIAACQKALSLNASFVPALVTLANILIKLNRYEEALSYLDQALRIAPDDADVLNNRGFVLTELQHTGEALESLDRALGIAPKHIGALDNAGVALYGVGRYEEALAFFDRALAVNSAQADVHYHRGQALANLGRHDEAIAAFQKVLELNPKHAEALGALAFSQLVNCNWKESERLRGELIRALEAGTAVIEPFTLLGYAIPPKDHLRYARQYARHRIRAVASLPSSGKQHRADKIKVAYLSSAFQRHPTAWQIVELIELHDRSRFEVLGISYGLDDGSDIRARLVKAFDGFSDVVLQSDREIAQLIRDNGVDIAVDLKGFTEKGRPGILAWRPAPVQVSYLGYTATMGVDFIDYILADRMVLPFDQQENYSEKIVQLPDTYWVNDSRRSVAEIPSRQSLGLPEDGFVFCCFNNSYKITAAIFDVWMRLLREVPESVLWLLQTNEAATNNLRNEARAKGIDPQRLVFAPNVEISQHLARHGAADLFLDNLPVNAHTAASDALWMGLPVLTCAGDAFVGRVALSLVTAAGLPELATRNLDEYHALAVKLANDRALLDGMREKLARDRMSSKLFDTKRLCAHIEAAYGTMLEMHQRGEPPRSFAV